MRCRYATKNYVGFLANGDNRLKMARSIIQIVHDYHRHMNGEEFDSVLSYVVPTKSLPSDINVENLDTRSLSLPFPVESILPTTRLIFASMDNKVRFALSDKQINSIKTGTNSVSLLILGADLLKHLLNPQVPIRNPSAQTYLHDKLTQIQFPANVTILKDKQLERRRRNQLNTKRIRELRIQRKKEEDELLSKVLETWQGTLSLRNRKRIIRRMKRAAKTTNTGGKLPGDLKPLEKLLL